VQLERNYDFCKRLLEVHKRNRRDRSLTPGADEFSFISPVRILMPPDAGEIIETAAKDGMVTLDKALNDLYEAGKISEKDLTLFKADHKAVNAF